jgi:hypothetical protein
MINIPREKVLERWDKLPQSLREAIFSEENENIIQNTVKTNNLTENQAQILSLIIGDIFRGFIHQNELANEIIKDLKINANIAASITSEINSKIFAQIKNDLEKAYEPISEIQKTELLKPSIKKDDEQPKIILNTPEPQPKPELEPKPIPTTPQPQAPSISVKPIFKETPFIIHQEETISLKDEPDEVKVSASRQTFYKPTFSGDYKTPEEKPVAAHLELGSDPEKKSEEPKIVGSGESRMRIVNYSDMRTEASPFNPSENIIIKPEEIKPQTIVEKTEIPATSQLNNKQETVQTAAEKKTVVIPENIINLKEGNKQESAGKPSVHPDNVVNLKDLPL